MLEESLWMTFHFETKRDKNVELGFPFYGLYIFAIKSLFNNKRFDGKFVFNTEFYPFLLSENLSFFLKKLFL